jgi:hypothetical protein
MANPDFLHLPIPRVFEGAAKLSGGGKESDQVKENRSNFKEHADFISGQFGSARNDYDRIRKDRQKANLPALPANTPFLLRIDEGTDPEFLLALGLEIVAETPEGVILVSTDDLTAAQFENRILRFAEQRYGGASIARILDLITVERIDERLKRILSPELAAKFYTIAADAQLVLDIGIECQGTERLPEYPSKVKDQDEERFSARVESWNERYKAALERIDNLQLEREQQFLDFVGNYGGETLEITQDAREYVLPDSFTVRVKLSGEALGDLARNYPFVFDIQQADILTIDQSAETMWQFELDFELVAPSDEARCLAIIDSGIQEQHPMLAAAIDGDSKCLIPGLELDVADYVHPSGHGTRVAGVAMYGNDQFPSGGAQYVAPFWIKNVRVLDADNCLPDTLFPPTMMKSVAEACLGGNPPASTINLSISGFYPCRISYMSAWAASIDEICYQEDLLVVTCAGNLPDESVSSRLGVVSAMNDGAMYPDYLLRPGCRIANPGQSLQALTVGATSIGQIDNADFRSIAGVGRPATYSASGFGIWGSIKPEVAVPVGDAVFSKAEPMTAKVDEATSAILLRSTLHGGPLIERDGIGTSYAAPIVAALSTRIHAVYPSLSSLARKAIIVSTASWPDWVTDDKREEAIRTIGYGLVDPDYALENDPYRIRLVSNGTMSIKQKQTHVYKVTIPDEIRSEENEGLVRVSVTVCFSAQPRRTRSTMKRYYASWVDWRSSRRSETFESFSSTVCKDADQDVHSTDEGAFPWVIGHAANYGIEGITRSNSACQKDWFVVAAHELSDEFGIAVTSHKGWDTNIESECKYALVIAFESLDQQTPIYLPIRIGIDELRQSLEVEVST